MESFLRRQRKCMEICIYRQLMTKSRGSSDPVQVRRVCADLVDQAFDDVREARVMGPSSLTHRTMEGADEVRCLWSSLVEPQSSFFHSHGIDWVHRGVCLVIAATRGILVAALEIKEHSLGRNGIPVTRMLSMAGITRLRPITTVS